MLNRITVQGRFTQDLELKTTTSGISVCSFTIANDDGYGEKKKTYFFNGVAWRGTADLICKWCKKGDMVIIDGKLTTRKYVDKNSNNRVAFEIVADNVHFAESKKDGNIGNKSTYETTGTAPYSKPDIANDDFEEMPSDDDLPF